MEYFEENISFSFEEPQMRSPSDFFQQNENSKTAQQHKGEAPCSALKHQGNSSKYLPQDYSDFPDCNTEITMVSSAKFKG